MALHLFFLSLAFLFLGISNAQLLNSYNFATQLKHIKVFVNEKELDTPVYKNEKDTFAYINEKGVLVKGDYYLSYVKLKNIFEMLDAKVAIEGNNIKITGKRTGDIKIIYKNPKNTSIILKGKELPSRLTDFSVAKIDEYYIQFSTVRYLIDGALKDGKNKIMLYSRDFERLDIPLTMEDCFFALDTLLTPEVKKDIKTSTKGDLIAKYHMGLGQWIRNNWLYPSDNRISKYFREQNVKHIDNMSGMIIEGYHRYLNGNYPVTK